MVGLTGRKRQDGSPMELEEQEGGEQTAADDPGSRGSPVASGEDDPPAACQQVVEAGTQGGEGEC